MLAHSTKDRESKTLDPAAALVALRAVEAELSALGGFYDPQLCNIIGLVKSDFPGALLTEIRKRLQ